MQYHNYRVFANLGVIPIVAEKTCFFSIKTSFCNFMWYS